MSDIVVTLDVDWAPDFVIDHVAKRLNERRICTTWFVTHSSPAIERLRQYPEYFELGIHPNFLPGSSHGDTSDTVLDHCMTLVPEATSVRTHSLVQSSPLLHRITTQTPITTDVSLFLPRTPFLRPVELQYGGRPLLRVPYYWGDNYEMECSAPCWHLEPLVDIGEGLKVFNFHPIHIYLNSTGPLGYEKFKHRLAGSADVSAEEASAYVNDGEGSNTLFTELTDYLAGSGGSLRIRDIHERWQK